MFGGKRVALGDQPFAGNLVELKRRHDLIVETARKAGATGKPAGNTNKPPSCKHRRLPFRFGTNP
jgi:hypothetical protein